MESLRYVAATNVTTLTIPARPGINTRVIEMWADGVPDRTYMDITIGPRTVARVPLRWNDCTFIAPYTGSTNNESIFALVRRIFGDDVYVEADQSEDIAFRFNNAVSRVHVLYQIHTETVRKELPLRSLQARVPLFHILTHSATINATRNYSLDVAIVPTGFPAFRDGDTIPAGCRFTLKALAFGSAKAGSTRPTAVHVWRREFELFTPETHTGVVVDPDSNFLVADVRTRDIFTVPEYAFGPGDKLTANFDATYDGSNAIAAQALALFLIGWFERVT